jgi:ABC-type sugar transport system permease subunit
VLSFFRWDGLGEMHFLGLQNYGNLFNDPLFWKGLWNTLFIGIIAHIPILLGGLILAYILNSKLVKFSNVFKTIYFMPMVTSAVAVTIIFSNMFGYNYGLLNWFLSLFGEEPTNWLGGDGSLIKVAVIVMFAWKWIGWNMVIYLAGMQGISNDIYEVLHEILQTEDIAIHIEAKHSCMTARGIKNATAVTITNKFSGKFQQIDWQHEFLQSVK